MDKLADALSSIKNEIMNKKSSVMVEKSNLVEAVLKVLRKENMISGFEMDGDDIKVTLKYVDGECAITQLKKVSKLGQRIYVSAYEILPVMNGRGIGIISTSEGVMSSAMAKSRNLGGEYLCKVW